MATLTISTSADPFQKQTVRLDGVDFGLMLSYNQREDRWYLSLADDEGAPIVSGLKLLANWPLLHRYKYDTRLPAGEIMVAVTTPDNSPPGLLDLGEGKRCELTYYDSVTIAAIRAATAASLKTGT